MSRNEAFAPWQCPLCGGVLQGENDLKCGKGHCFDRAREGYWHLLPVQSMRTKAPGDSKEMVAARRAFLNAGYYGIFGQALGELCLADRILEAGREQLRLAPLIRALFCEVNPIPVKTAMARMGLCSDLLRLPLCEMSEENRARLFAAMDACGVSA